MRIIKSEPHHEAYPDLSPTKTTLPKWYKDIPAFTENGNPSFGKKTAKLCAPFLDSFTTGYVMPLVGDLEIKQLNGFPTFNWGFVELLHLRPPTGVEPPAPQGYTPQFYAWSTHVSFSLPKGYSALITHPLNRFDLPFITSSGIIDDFEMPGGDIPFFLREGFEGVIPQGTPIFQIIPFKREDWRLERDKGLAERTSKTRGFSNLVVSGWYKKTHWKKKNYN